MFEAVNDAWPNRHLLITQRLRQRRVDLGLTQKQVVSRLARAGVRTTNRAVSSLEHGCGVDVARLPEIATALDCTVTYLIGLTADPHRWEPDGDAQPTRPPRRVADSAQPAPEPRANGSLLLGADLPSRDLRL